MFKWLRGRHDPADGTRCEKCNRHVPRKHRSCPRCGAWIGVKNSLRQADARMEFPLWLAVGNRQLEVEPGFLRGYERNASFYVDIVGKMLSGASVIDASAKVVESLERLDQVENWSAFGPLGWQQDGRWVEVDLATVGPVGHMLSVTGLPHRWAALMSMMPVDPAFSKLPWWPKNAHRMISVDLVLQHHGDGTCRSPFAQLWIPLDRTGRAIAMKQFEQRSWFGTTYGAQGLQMPQVIDSLMNPIVRSLAEESGGPMVQPYRSVEAYPIRAFVESLRSKTRYTEALLMATPYDASAEAEWFLLHELHPDGDLRNKGPLMPPENLVYIEVQPPTRMINSEGVIRPMSNLVGAGVGWSALVNFDRNSSGATLTISMNHLSVEGSNPRLRISDTTIALDHSGRATTKESETMLHLDTGDRENDPPNLGMWLEPVLRRLEAFNG